MSEQQECSEQGMDGALKYLFAFSPYARMMRGVEAETPEMKELLALRQWGDDPDAFANRKRVQEFIDRECAAK